VPLPWIAGAPLLPRVLLLAPDVEQREQRIAEPRLDLLPRRQRTRVCLERALAHRLELDRPFDELARPRRHASEQDRDVRMPGELGHLRRRHRADTVAAIDEHEALRTGDAVSAQAQRDLFCELGHRSGVGSGRRRAEDERTRTGDVAPRVRVRAAHVPDHDVTVVEVRGKPRRVDDRRTSGRQDSTSIATAGSTSPSSSRSDGRPPSSETPSRSRARNTQGT
jgi:hypothetical protein